MGQGLAVQKDLIGPEMYVEWMGVGRSEMGEGDYWASLNGPDYCPSPHVAVWTGVLRETNHPCMCVDVGGGGRWMCLCVCMCVCVLVYVHIVCKYVHIYVHTYALRVWL